MITNSSLTIYHKEFDNTSRLEKWIRYNFDKVWFFGGKGSSINKGYENANNVDIRIEDINVNVSIGDIVVQGTINQDIQTQQDLSNYDVYNVTSINVNNFGNTPHTHIGAK